MMASAFLPFCVYADDAGCPAAAGPVASGTSVRVRLKSGKLVGAARNAYLWDFCGARRRLPKAHVAGHPGTGAPASEGQPSGRPREVDPQPATRAPVPLDIGAPGRDRPGACWSAGLRGRIPGVVRLLTPGRGWLR